MEQNADAGTPVAPVMDNKQKSSNGLKITRNNISTNVLNMWNKK